MPDVSPYAPPTAPPAEAPRPAMPEAARGALWLIVGYVLAALAPNLLTAVVTFEAFQRYPKDEALAALASARVWAIALNAVFLAVAALGAYRMARALPVGLRWALVGALATTAVFAAAHCVEYARGSTSLEPMSRTSGGVAQSVFAIAIAASVFVLTRRPAARALVAVALVEIAMTTPWRLGFAPSTHPTVSLVLDVIDVLASLTVLACMFVVRSVLRRPSGDARQA